MGKIREKFDQLKDKGKKAFIPYFTFGFPDMKTFESIIFTLDRSGADFIEIGLPFSDPVADGPLIQASSRIALEKGANISALFSFLKEVKKKLNSPIILMSYYNPIYHMGLDNFFKKAESLLEGVIVADLLAEEAGDFVKCARAYQIDTIFFVSPTTQEERLPLIERVSSGFIYYISVTGVTGPRQVLPSAILKHLRKIRKKISLPLCLGFGISNQSQARKFKNYFDGIIVGSALVDKVFKLYRKKNFLKKFRDFVLWLNG